MGNTRVWAAALWVVHVAVAALAVVLVVFLEDAVRGVRGEEARFPMMVPLSLIFATFVWMVLAGALVALSFIDPRRKNMTFTLTGAASSAFWVVHVAVAALPIVFVVLVKDIPGPGGLGRLFSWGYVALVWTVLSGTLVALFFIDRRRKNMTFTLIGAASSAFVFVGAVVCAPSLYGWDLRPLGWYALLATSVPLLMFAGILLRDAPFSSRLPYLRHGLVAGAFLALAAGIALQMKVAASESGFGRELGASIDTGVTEIHFSEITDFEWDLVEIYGAYTMQRALSEAVREGVDALTLSHFGIGDFSLVVFIDEDRVVYYEIVPDTVAHIYDSDNQNPTVRRYGEARARVEPPEEGWPFPRLRFE